MYRFANLPAVGRPAQARSAIAPVATVGLWECDLASEALSWSDGVYDLFDLPRGSAVDRKEAVRLYDPQSRIAMECLRTAAIRDRSGFSVDALICSALGVERWIRITGQVECLGGRAVRLFGAKHDVTQEHALWESRGLRPDIAHFR